MGKLKPSPELYREVRKSAEDLLKKLDGRLSPKEVNLIKTRIKMMKYLEMGRMSDA